MCPETRARAPAPGPSTPGLQAGTRRVLSGRQGCAEGRARSAAHPRPHLASGASGEGRDRPGGGSGGCSVGGHRALPAARALASAGGRALASWKVEETTNSRT